MHTTPLHPCFGVEVHDVDLRQVTSANGYPEIRQAFETHSLLLFRDQSLDDEAHLAFGALFGPIEDRSMGKNGPKPHMDNVTNRLADNTIAAEEDNHTLNLKANQLWHTDSTFLPVPALANILAARVVSSRGGETKFVSTRAAWTEMPEDLKARARNAVLRHRFFAFTRQDLAELAKLEKFAKWPDQAWRAIWQQSCQRRGCPLHRIARLAVDGLPEAEGQTLIEELIALATRAGSVYAHTWRVGDVLMWDERATLHRGRPWPYEEEHTLASICITARDVDGLDLVRPN